jgi:hypothetical protein
MRISSEHLRRIIQEELAGSSSPEDTLTEAMSLIETAASLCMRLGDYSRYPEMTQHSRKLAGVHRALANASLEIEEIKDSLESAPSFRDPDIDEPL